MLYPKIDCPFKREGKELTREWRRPIYESLAGASWDWYDKWDGTNIRLYYSKLADSMAIKGRTEKAEIPRPLLEYLTEVTIPKAIDFCKDFYRDVVIFGEGVGPKIQGNPHNLSEPSFVGFDIAYVSDSASNWRWMRKSSAIAALTGLDIVTPRYVCKGPICDAISTVNLNLLVEGLVGTLDLVDFNGDRLALKIKNRDFKHG